MKAAFLFLPILTLTCGTGGGAFATTRTDDISPEAFLANASVETARDFLKNSSSNQRDANLFKDIATNLNGFGSSVSGLCDQLDGTDATSQMTPSEKIADLLKIIQNQAANLQDAVSNVSQLVGGTSPVLDIVSSLKQSLTLLNANTVAEAATSGGGGGSTDAQIKALLEGSASSALAAAQDVANVVGTSFPVPSGNSDVYKYLTANGGAISLIAGTQSQSDLYKALSAVKKQIDGTSLVQSDNFLAGLRQFQGKLSPTGSNLSEAAINALMKLAGISSITFSSIEDFAVKFVKGIGGGGTHTSSLAETLGTQWVMSSNTAIGLLKKNSEANDSLYTVIEMMLLNNTPLGLLSDFDPGAGAPPDLYGALNNLRAALEKSITKNGGNCVIDFASSSVTTTTLGDIYKALPNKQ